MIFNNHVIHAWYDIHGTRSEYYKSRDQIMIVSYIYDRTNKNTIETAMFSLFPCKII